MRFSDFFWFYFYKSLYNYYIRKRVALVGSAAVQHVAIDLIPKHIWSNEPYKSNNSASKPFYFKNTERYSYSKEDYVLWEMPEDKLSVCFFTTGV